MNEMAIDASKLDKFNDWRHLLESSRFASESNGKRISRLSQHFGSLRRKQLLYFSTRWPTDRFCAMSYFSQETSTGSRKNAQNFLNSNPRIFGEIVHAGKIENPATKCRVFSANFVGRKNSRRIKSLYVAAATAAAAAAAAA